MSRARLLTNVFIFVAALGLLARPATVLADKNADVAKAMDDAKLTLDKAVQAAETESKGKAVAAHAKLDGKDAAVVVHCLVGDKCMLVTVDQAGKAGKPVEATEKDEKDNQAAKAADVVKAFATDKTSLSAAVAEAEKECSATAVSAVSKLHGEKLTVDLQCVAAGKTTKCTFDAKTGKVKVHEAKTDKKDAKKDEKKESKEEKKGDQPPPPNRRQRP